MPTAIANLCARGKRDELVEGMLTYAHNAWLTEYFFQKGLKAAGLDYADVLLLSWFPKRPSQKIIDGALRLKEEGLVRFIGLTSSPAPTANSFPSWPKRTSSMCVTQSNWKH